MKHVRKTLALVMSAVMLMTMCGSLFGALPAFAFDNTLASGVDGGISYRVELNGDAVKDAIANAKLNGIKNAWFTAGDAGEAMVRMAREGQRPDVVLMDPPRAGSDELFLKSVLKAAPKTVVYISCCVETLARDLKMLTAGGYRVRQIQPVDMFPFTEHVESVVLITRA